MTSNALLMPRALMPFDRSLKIRSLTCNPRSTVMVGPFLSENDEYMSETLPYFITRSIKGVMLFLEDAVLLGGAFGNEIV